MYLIFSLLWYLFGFFPGMTTESNNARTVQHMIRTPSLILGLDQQNQVYGLALNWTVLWTTTSVSAGVTAKESQTFFLFDDSRKLGVCCPARCTIFVLDEQKKPRGYRFIDFLARAPAHPVAFIKPSANLNITGHPFYLEARKSPVLDDKWLIIALCVFGGLSAAVVAAATGCLVGKRRRKTKEEMYEVSLSAAPMEQEPEFRFDRFIPLPPVIPTAPHLSLPSLLSRELGTNSSSSSAPVMDMIKTFSADGLIIKPEALELGAELGEGNFGIVHCACYTTKVKRRNSRRRVVAVKRLKSLATDKDFKNLLQEAFSMKDLNHKNVMPLLGVCVTHRDGTVTESPQLVMPYMMNKDLHTYIRKNVIGLGEALGYGLQVAEGMDYLGQCRFVHRDLAARNCMLDDDMQVKISDFGLARDIYERNVYNRPADSESEMPARWTAPECVFGSYTSMSDVWSFGILLWEVLSHGALPYSEIAAVNVMNHIRTGKRLKQPTNCPSDVYQLMMLCWKSDPGARPEFSWLATELQTVADETSETSEEHPMDKHHYINGGTLRNTLGSHPDGTTESLL